MKASRLLCRGTSWGTALSYVPEKFRVDHSPSQYGVEKSFPAPSYPQTLEVTGDENEGIYSLTRGMTPPSEHKLYSPMNEPFLVPPKYRKQYNFSTSHGRYLYSKDPLWVEARERHWDDLQSSLYIHKQNYHHMRRKYRKQWQDAHRYNLDEYLSVLNRVRRQEKAEQSVVDERREKEWVEDLSRIDAIGQLQEKRRQLRIERKWQINVWLFERYSEELQLLSPKVDEEFITYENLQSRIDSELGRWTQTKGRLNMFGRIPYLESGDCIPDLEPQFSFMREGLEHSPKEAFSRLEELARQQGIAIAKEYKQTDFGTDIGQIFEETVEADERSMGAGDEDGVVVKGEDNP